MIKFLLFIVSRLLLALRVASDDTEIVELSVVVEGSVKESSNIVIAAVGEDHILFMNSGRSYYEYSQQLKGKVFEEDVNEKSVAAVHGGLLKNESYCKQVQGSLKEEYQIVQ